MHTGVMAVSQKVVRQSVSLPAPLARKVRSMAKTRRTSASRILVELVEEGIELRRQKEKAFFDLAGRCRSATKPEQVAQLGDELGRMVFGE